MSRFVARMLLGSVLLAFAVVGASEPAAACMCAPVSHADVGFRGRVVERVDALRPTFRFEVEAVHFGPVGDEIVVSIGSPVVSAGGIVSSSCDAYGEPIVVGDRLVVAAVKFSGGYSVGSCGGSVGPATVSAVSGSGAVASTAVEADSSLTSVSELAAADGNGRPAFLIVAAVLAVLGAVVLLWRRRVTRAVQG